jgi:hypothetical protein
MWLARGNVPKGVRIWTRAEPLSHFHWKFFKEFYLAKFDRENIAEYSRILSRLHSRTLEIFIFDLYLARSSLYFVLGLIDINSPPATLTKVGSSQIVQSILFAEAPC